MEFLQDLHGTIAVVLLCALLFAEECGVPLPFAPGDFLLIAAGLLIATGALDARRRLGRRAGDSPAWSRDPAPGGRKSPAYA